MNNRERETDDEMTNDNQPAADERKEKENEKRGETRRNRMRWVERWVENKGNSKYRTGETTVQDTDAAVWCEMTTTQY